MTKDNLKIVQDIKDSLEEFKEQYQKVKAETDFYLKKSKDEFGTKEINKLKELRDKLIKQVSKLQEEFDTELEEIKEAMEEEDLI